MPYVSEIVIPISRPQTLKTLFNNTAYKAIKSKTGISIFDLMRKPDKFLEDSNVLCAILFCGTRKFHNNLSEENLGEWLDELETVDLLKVYTSTMQALCAGFLDPIKRDEYLKKINAPTLAPVTIVDPVSCEVVTSTISGTTTPPPPPEVTNGRDTSSGQLNLALA